MSRQIVASFLIGCAVGGLVVGLWGRGSEPAAATSTDPVVGSSVKNSVAPVTAPAIAPIVASHEKPRDGAASPPSAPQGLHDEGSRRDVDTGGYSFSHVTDSEQRLEDIFTAERIDPVWSSQTVDSLNLVLSAMPERSVIGDYGLTCKDSLCKLEIKGSQEQIAGQRAENNVQVAMHRIMQQPPASEIFDDYTLGVGFDDKDNQATITLFAHRRKPK